MEAKDIIQQLGGPAAVGRHFGILSQAVSQWSKKGRIPAYRVPGMEAMARARGLNIRAEHIRPDIDWSSLRVPEQD